MTFSVLNRRHRNEVYGFRYADSYSYGFEYYDTNMPYNYIYVGFSIIYLFQNSIQLSGESASTGTRDEY